jgi:hypothetical protein
MVIHDDWVIWWYPHDKTETSIYCLHIPRALRQRPLLQSVLSPRGETRAVRTSTSAGGLWGDILNSSVDHVNYVSLGYLSLNH